MFSIYKIDGSVVEIPDDMNEQEFSELTLPFPLEVAWIEASGDAADTIRSLFTVTVNISFRESTQMITIPFADTEIQQWYGDVARTIWGVMSSESKELMG